MDYTSIMPLGKRFSYAHHSRRSDAPRRAKRVLDISLCLLVLPFAAPLIGLAAIAVALDGGPSFYGHRRVGKDGRFFRCWKLRTMVTNSEERLQTHLATNPCARDEWERAQKLTNDPRITAIGSFLRKSSIDELPQIWNVLKGEMSLVGPRPVVADELRKYGPYQTHYFDMHPGITGLWQISGRNRVSYEERVTLDVTYHRTQSVGEDLKILFQTIAVVLHMTGE